ncbi:hypothetical protein NGM99_06040 [Mesorhizobium sp. RP14(2022)]|uniref:Biotin carboxyl carrier protein of acetyl-CoA carboxylase n=1 Tax=Mesorhizobium liriopis TaxID=2953882 RepID=A0ABT1C3X4_9HYPH|nr:biotin/lipoyl-containing protein [Mesorhizobium liriopis]MCO6049348.1 hypothetical protein [Mesorhizobium liriopis]
MSDAATSWDGLSEAVAVQAGDGNKISYEFSYADVLEILRLVDSTPNVRKLSLAIGDLKVEVERDGASDGEVQSVALQPKAAAPVASPVPEPWPSRKPAAKPAQDNAVNAVSVRSPIAGIFYRAPAPGEPSFVEVGTEVEADTVVGIIEVMKVMNNIRAGSRGVISEICVDNEDLVQFDQTLFHLDAPAGDNA